MPEPAPIKNKTIKRVKLFSLILSLLVLIFFTYSIINYGLLKNQIEDGLGNQVIKYGYIAVFILAFLLEGTPQPFVSALFPFINGLMLGLDFQILLLVTIMGATLSGFTTYVIGLIYGKKLAVKITGEETFEKYNSLFKRYGKPGMVIIALTPFPYFPILGGIFKMDLRDFITFAIIPRIFHFVIFGYIFHWIV
jgi:membrane protein YqaA with SNARE-associated domain